MKQSLVVIILIFLTCCKLSFVKEKNTDKIEQQFTYQNGDIIELFTKVGFFNEYKVYNCFRKIKSADSYHGQSFTLFLSNKDTLVYIMEQKENLPDSVVNNLFYKNGISSKVLELSNPLCIHSECYELVVEFKELILSLDSLG